MSDCNFYETVSPPAGICTFELAPLLHGLSKVNLMWRNKQGLFILTAYS